MQDRYFKKKYPGIHKQECKVGQLHPDTNARALATYTLFFLIAPQVKQ